MEGFAMQAARQVVKFRVEDATKHCHTRTGAVHALEGVSFDVREGELVCVLGPSGCGKSTLLWAMSGLHRLTRGRILLDGAPVTRPHPAIVMIFQEANLLPWRNLLRPKSGGEANGLDKARVKAAADGYKLPTAYESVNVEIIQAKI